MESPIHYIRGCVAVTVEGTAPEGLLNSCSKHGIAFWKVSPVSDYRMNMTVYRRDREKLFALAERSQCRIEKSREFGLPRTARPLKRRYVFLAGLALCALLLLWSSLFIWNFEVTGNESLSSAEVLAALEECGVELGSFWPFMSSDLIRCRALLRVPELSWLTVNVHGSTATVVVREGVPKPEILDEKQPTDVVAEKAGLIIEVRTYRGETLTVKNATVDRGDMLISGAVSSPGSAPRLVHAYGAVYARTWYDLTAQTRLVLREKRPAGGEDRRFALVLGNTRINFYSNSGISGTGCDKIVQEYQLGIKGVFTLPVTLVKETFSEYTLSDANQDKAALRERLQALLLQELQQELGEGGAVVASSFSVSESEGYLVVTLHAECVENIAREVSMTDARIQEIKAAQEAQKAAEKEESQ